MTAGEESDARRPWQPVEWDARCADAMPRPLESLARGEIPALLLRGAYPRDACVRLLRRLLDERLLYDPSQPVPEKFLAEAIPEGFYREGVSREARRASTDVDDERKRRIDIGTSLGYRGSDPEAFFAHARETQRLFRRLFAGLPDPVEVLYRNLSELSCGQRAVTAREPDGREYGPAIIRAHYGSYTYRPHFDSVRLREKREGYAVHDFEHQFAGVLLLQNSASAGESAQCILHRCLWEPEVQPHLDAGTFHDFARERGIESCRVALEPGDLYFFNTRLIHEVPGLESPEPRVVLATFIGYGSGREEMFVWS